MNPIAAEHEIHDRICMRLEMVYKGKMQHGVVIFDKPAGLPNGLEVEVRVTDSEDNGPTLFERLESVVGNAKGLPSDLARNHDHYIHGRLKE